MNRKRVLVVSLVVLLAGVVIRLVQDNVLAQNPGVVPFTVMQDETYTVNGKLVRRAEKQIARKADGSYSGQTTTIGKKDGAEARIVVKEILDVSAQRFAVIDHFTQSKSTGALPEGIQHQLQTHNKGASCTDNLLPNASVETETMLGYQVAKTTETALSPKGSDMTLVMWRVPVLNCFRLKEKVTIVSQEGTISETIKTTRSIFQGEPASSLFEIPTHYTERSPADVEAETARMLDRACLECGSEVISRAEERYWKSQLANQQRSDADVTK